MASYKLRRSSKDKILFGVCGGIAEYFNIDALFVRIAFIITAFFNGFGIILYLALALIMPKDEAEIGDAAKVMSENIQSIKEDVLKAGQRIKETFAAADDQRTVAETSANGNDRRRNTFAFVLIIIGIIFLLANFGIFWWFDWDKLWPAILILLGIIIILKRRRQ